MWFHFYILCVFRFDDCVEGGESILKDIFQVAEKLRKEYPDEFQTLTEVPIVYETKGLEREIPSYYEHQKTHIETDYNGEVSNIYCNI